MPTAEKYQTESNSNESILRFRCDLHVHTCLSPCAELDMYPQAIVEKALAEKIDILGICDHNASENVSYVIKAAAGKPLMVMPGMEITSREEVHVLALFGPLTDLIIMQETIYKHLAGMNREEIFGCQAIVNADDQVEGFNDHFLLGATSLSLLEIIAHIHRLNGLAIAAHIDRESFGVLGQLGFIDPDWPFDALEVSRATGIRQGRLKYQELSRYPFLESSDAHFIRDIGRGVTDVFMRNGSIEELKMAFQGRDGRYVRE